MKLVARPFLFPGCILEFVPGGFQPEELVDAFAEAVMHIEQDLRRELGVALVEPHEIHSVRDIDSGRYHCSASFESCVQMSAPFGGSKAERCIENPRLRFRATLQVSIEDGDSTGHGSADESADQGSG